MDPRRYIDATRIPFSREGFYATNNQFQKAGSKGFIQVKVLENKDLYVRVDLPGVPDDAIKLEIDDVSEKIYMGSVSNSESSGSSYTSRVKYGVLTLQFASP